MNPYLTLAAIGALTAASLTASAQFTVDGKASADEMGTGPGKYQLAASYSGNHLDADRGVTALYAGYTATTLNLMVVGSAESASGSSRAIVLYLNTKANAGAPAGTALIGGNDGTSPLKHKPTLDQKVDFGFRVSVGPTSGMASDVYFSNVSYVSDKPLTVPGTDAPTGQGSKSGAVVTAAAGTPLPGTKYAYLNTASLTANTNNAGLEIEIPLSSLGTNEVLKAGSTIDLFAAFTDGDGVFFSETLPQIAGQALALGANPSFPGIAGTQSVAFVLSAAPLASHSEVANSFAFNVYPNPARASSTIAYTVPGGGQQPVSLAVYNAMGQRVRTLFSAKQGGSQQLPLGSLPAGAYFVKLQIGDQATSRKLVVE